ncbi:MAG: pyruvate dehydrogenase, partial [Bdellovibrionales bacterium]|nr:pyruvate dehydrogenase [Bdellovibrionales bacterium]
MIYQANHRTDKAKGDPKVGGHASASASALHIMGALHLLVKDGHDHIANKPHASPTDHSYNYLMDLFLKNDFSRLTLEECNTAMMGLRKYSQNGEPVFQSYHSAYDSDQHNFFPSGTVGIPPVKAGYLALAYRYAAEHDYETPKAHFWALTGDSEFREGSIYEAVPDFAEREIGNLTWIVDYNRQSLDGHRITNKEIMSGTDADRIERTMSANGWEVIQVRHGHRRQNLFAKPGGEVFKNFLEKELADYELQALLLVKDMKALKKGIIKEHPSMKKFLEQVSDEELYLAIRDFGGHDILALADAMESSKKSKRKPTIIIAHTLKGWGLKMAAMPGNHSALPSEDEVNELKSKQGISGDTLFARFDANSAEGKFLNERGQELYTQILKQNELKEKNKNLFLEKLTQHGELPDSLDINTKLVSYPHTQWMLGQLTAKLTRLANTAESQKDKPLSDFEKKWKLPGELMISMAPDVGTSTNLNPAMDGKIFGAPVVTDYEDELGAKEDKTPDLVPGEEVSDRYLRFEIAEGNVMSCVGAFGKLRDILGIPIIPLMTVYDFFIKRAHDQYFYNLYWKSNFILVGTPSGVTLSPEGAQHGWKSDFQIPNQITWEPFFCAELDWILCDAISRHVTYNNQGRNGVLIRGVTRGVEQKDMLTYLKKQARFKTQGAVLCRSEYTMENATPEDQIENVADNEILEAIKSEVLQGGYYLINYQHYAGYVPGENVVNIFAMGALGTEAIKASEVLLSKGIYANVII